MKVILTDNYDREIYNDKLIKGNLSKDEAKKLADELNNGNCNDELYYMAVEEGYSLFERDF